MGHCDLVSREALRVETSKLYQLRDQIATSACRSSLGCLNEPVFSQEGAQVRSHGPTIGFLLFPYHYYQTVVIEQDGEVLLRYQLPGRDSDIHPVLRFPVGIALRPFDKFG